jgi:hypothetical protein
MKKELIIMISLLIIAMFMVSACSSGQAFKDADKKGLDMKLGAKDDGKEFEDVNPNSAPIESGTVEEACTETDDGNDIFNYGVVRFNGEAYEDECGDSTEIKEFYCVSDEEMGVEKQYCPEMTECYRGACEHYCTDSDGGHNYAVQGEVTGWNVGLNQFDTQVDVCNNGFLVEIKNSSQLKKKIEMLIINKDLRLHMGENSKKLYFKNAWKWYIYPERHPWSWQF